MIQDYGALAVGRADYTIAEPLEGGRHLDDTPIVYVCAYMFYDYDDLINSFVISLVTHTHTHREKERERERERERQC